MSSSSLRLVWKPYEVAPGLSVVVPAEGSLGVQGTPDHGWVTSGNPPVLVGIWYGPGEDMAHWRGGFVPDTRPNTTFGKEARTRICGRPARRLEAHTPQRGADRVMVADEDTLLEHPATDSIAVEFQHHGAPVVAYYIIESDQRRAYAADEAHYFSSIHCD